MITLHAFTDPVCVWCWAAEALFRGLETHYPDSLEIHHIAGGMVKDIRVFDDPDAGLTGNQTMAQINASIAQHYEESAQIHHMPVHTKGFRLFSEASPSSWPQNIAYKAAQIATPQHANRFLRRVRQATMTQALPTAEAPVLYELAGICGIDQKKYAAALTDGSALKAFQQDLHLGAENGVDLFPTFILQYQGKSMRLLGHIPYPEFAESITKLTAGTVLPRPSPPDDEALLALLDKYQTLSREEIRQAFDFAEGQTPDAWCRQLEQAGKLRISPAGSSWLVIQA